MGDRPDAGPSIQLPVLEKLVLNVTAQPSNGKLGIGVLLTGGGDHRARSVLRDGRPAPVQVRVTDAAGKEVAALKGPLTDFGFS